MKTDRERLFYYIGTSLLAVAMVELTIFPYIINNFFPVLFIPVDNHRKIVAYIFLLSFLSYAFSLKFYKKQLGAIFIMFVYYFAFQFFISI